MSTARPPATCPQPGCDHDVTDGRCPVHGPTARRRHDTRESWRLRGYDADYDRARAAALADATACATCGRPFTEDNPATGGHVRAIRRGGSTADGIVAECRACNYGWRRTGR